MTYIKQTIMFCLIFMIGMATYAEEIPNNQIWYEANKKLPEVSDYNSYGLHINAFNVEIGSHTFSNGKGVIKFYGEVTNIITVR